jgi:hypothetical protein
MLRRTLAVIATAFLFQGMVLAARLPIPDKKAQADADKAIRELFHEGYAKRSPADKRALCQKLLEQAESTTDDTTALYTLLRNAMDLAIEAADAEQLAKAADAIGAKFEADQVALKVDGIARSTTAVSTAELARPMTQASLTLIDEVVAKERFDLLDRLATPTTLAARKSGDAELASQAQTRIKDAREIQADFTKCKAARVTLAAKPADPAANATVGRFVCLIKNEWDSGLPLLVKGNDTSLKPLAEKELANPSTTKEQIELADSWFDLAATQKRRAELASLQGRAAYWYEKALPAITGLQKLRIEKRLETIKSPPADAPANAVATPSRPPALTRLQRDSFQLELQSLQAKAQAESDVSKHAAILISAADIAIKLGDANNGFAELDNVVKDARNDDDVRAKALIVKATHLTGMNRWNEAEDCLALVVRKFRGSYGNKGCEAANLIAKHYESLRQLDKASAAKLLVIECGGAYEDPAGEASMWLAERCLAKGDKAQAVVYLRGIIEKHPGSYGGWKKKAEAKLKEIESR